MSTTTANTAPRLKQRYNDEIKATLEAVEIGIVSFEDAMLPYTVLPNGSTVAEQVGADVAKAYIDHAMPALALGSGKGK